MQRNDAIAYLKELLDLGLNISPDAVSLEEKDTPRKVEVRIKISVIQRESIKDVAKNQNLTVREEGETIVIYS